MVVVGIGRPRLTGFSHWLLVLLRARTRQKNKKKLLSRLTFAVRTKFKRGCCHVHAYLLGEERWVQLTVREVRHDEFHVVSAYTVTKNRKVLKFSSFPPHCSRSQKQKVPTNGISNCSQGMIFEGEFH